MKRKGLLAIALVLATSCSSETGQPPASPKTYRPNLTDVAIGTYPGQGELFAVATSDDGRVQWSFDFVSWSAGEAPGGPALRTVAAGTNGYLIGGDDYRLTVCTPSYRGCNYARGSGGAYRASAFCGSLFYVVGEKGVVATIAGPGATASAQGTTDADVVVGVACSPSTVVAVTENDATYAGPIGGTVERTAGTGKACGVAFGNGLFVAARTDGTIATSPDGKTWTAAAAAQGSATEACDAAFGGGTFVIATSNGDVLSSGDGRTWTRVTYGASTRLNGVALNDAGRMLAVGNGIAVEATCSGGTCSGAKTHEILVEAIGSGDAGK
jgi:hypothetical protein